MEVGEYVRTKDGFIRKIDKIEKCPVCEEKEYINEEIISGLHFQNSYHKKDITKHSKNPKDLIEPGDFVNGKCCIDIEEYIRDNGTTNINFICLGGSVLAEDIKSIVTKEQFKSIEYEV